jgi:hypothetical protein
MASNIKQRKIRLGEGELEHIRRDGLSASIKDARDYFLDAVKEVAPEVLDDLANEPFKLYKEAGLALDYEQYEKEFETLEKYDLIRAKSKIEQDHSFNHPRWEQHFEVGKVDYDEKILAMQESIFSWSKKHNLDVAWCRARAYETVEWWHRSGSSYENRRWNWDMEMQPVFTGSSPIFQFSYKSLYPVFRFRKDEREIITRAFENELNEFLDERERIAKENGMVSPKQKREYLHFVWFAYYQVKNWSQKDIQENFYASRRTVGEALDSIRNLLKTPNDPKSELTRLPSKAGRPSKN